MLQGKFFIIVFSFLSIRIAAVGRTTEWHEGHQKNEVIKRNKVNEKLMESELKHANVELKTLRRERLLQLYQGECEKYESELNGMGFAILKDRL